jgi:hypothetical protein
MGRYHSDGALGLDPLDWCYEATRDAQAANRECVLHAESWEAKTVLLQPQRVR